MLLSTPVAQSGSMGSAANAISIEVNSGSCSARALCAFCSIGVSVTRSGSSTGGSTWELLIAAGSSGATIARASSSTVVEPISGAGTTGAGAEGTWAGPRSGSFVINQTPNARATTPTGIKTLRMPHCLRVSDTGTILSSSADQANLGQPTRWQ